MDTEMADLVIEGVSTKETGASIAIGDLNQDGDSDLVIGGPDGVDGNPSEVWIFFGPLPEGRVSVDDADVTLAEAGDSFGRAVATVPAIDGGTGHDLLVGAPDFDGNGKAYRFAAGEFSEPREGRVDAESAATAQWHATTGEKAGWSVSAFDYDNDGTREVVIGAPKYTASDVGRVWIVPAHTGPGSVELNPADPALVVIEGVRSHAELGTYVAGAGDLNLDGYEDLLLSAKTAHGSEEVGGHSQGGAAHLLYGSPAPAWEGQTIDLISGAVLHGDRLDDLQLARPLGDMDGDGYPDIGLGAVGSTGKVWVLFTEGG
jgi:hypothetical protein